VFDGCKCRSSLPKELIAKPQVPYLDLRGDFEAGKKRERGRKGGEKEGKKGKNTPPNEFLFTALHVSRGIASVCVWS